MNFTIFYIFAIFLVMSFSHASAATIEPEGPLLRRFRRFTCDVLSVEAGTVKVAHAACALHCVAIGRRGGYCNNQAVCVCR